MKSRRLKKILFFPALLCLLLMMGGLTAFAAEVGQADVLLPVEQTFEAQNAPEGLDSSFRYRLKAEDGAPLPKGADQDIYEFTLTGNAKGQIGPISYVHAGVYSYTLSQVIDDAKDHYTYDRQTYQVRVYVQNRDGGGLSTQVIIENEAGKKMESGLFNNGYQGTEPENPPSPPGELTDGPQTGDNTDLSVWILTACLSGFMVLILLKRRYRENRENQNRSDS